MEKAAKEGLRFFDTAAMYGQGDAERALGCFLRASRNQEISVCTKGGYRTRGATIIRCLKPLLRAGHRMRAKTRNESEAAVSVPASGASSFFRAQHFEGKFLQKSLGGSLRRLGLPYVDFFLLHDPPPHVFGNGNVESVMKRFVSEGRIGDWGVGTSNLDSISACLESCNPGIIQTAVNLRNINYVISTLKECQNRDIFVVANSVLVDCGRTHQELVSLYRTLLGCGALDVILSGTTSMSHLEMNVCAFREAGGFTF
jgi:aryl-alcohol dehydrogenase-like predicted oxidoreductase